MKYLYTTIALPFLYFFFSSFDFRDALVACLATGVLLYLLDNRIRYYFLMRDYANRYENIYVVSMHPNGEQSADIEGLNDFIIQAPYRKVFKEVERQKALLIESRNAHYTDEGLKPSERLKVVPIIFQDAEAINETWPKFCKRVRKEIQADRAERHAILKKADPIWYHKYANYQQGVSWGVK